MSRLAADLNPQQKAAVTHAGGPCLVLAGAGSGKTRVITSRIAWLIQEKRLRPEQICAVTFTNKAAAEMRARLGRLLGSEPDGLWLLTFHALGLRFLRDVAGKPGAPRSGFAIYDRADSLATWRGCQGELSIDSNAFAPNHLYESCSRARNRLEDPVAWDQAGRPPEQRMAARIFGAYRKAMRSRNAVDFDDLLAWPLDLLSQRARLRRRWQERFTHLLVDEYQDTNRLQYRLVRALLGDESSLMVVGDEDQSIYRWRGADLANVLDFQSDFPGATVVRLEQNYRSTQPILRAAGSLVAHNKERLGKQLWSDLPGEQVPTFMLCAEERQEAIWVAKQVSEALSGGVVPSEFAVLFRTNAQSRPFEEEFAARAIPFRVVGGPTFYRRSEVKDVLSWLRLLCGADDAALTRALSTPPRGVGPKTLATFEGSGAGAAEELLGVLAATDPAAALRTRGCPARAIPGLLTFAQTLSAARRKIGQVSLEDLLLETLATSGYADYLRSRPDGEERRGNVDTLIASAAEFAGPGPCSAQTLAAFLDRSALVSDTDTTKSPGGTVSLMTIHSAKGLEFHTVFVAGLEEGTLPHDGAIKEGAVEEERRLCYVAMTRARHQLFLSAARLRRVHGQERFQRTSRFVGEIDPRAVLVRESPTIIADAARAVAGAASSSRTRRSSRSGNRPAKMRPVPADARGTGIAAGLDRLTAGTGVFHPKFGPGRIGETQGSGEQLKLTVSFVRSGTKQLIARFAKLQLLAGGRQ